MDFPIKLPLSSEIFRPATLLGGKQEEPWTYSSQEWEVNKENVPLKRQRAIDWGVIYIYTYINTQWGLKQQNTHGFYPIKKSGLTGEHIQ